MISLVSRLEKAYFERDRLVFRAISRIAIIEKQKRYMPKYTFNEFSRDKELDKCLSMKRCVEGRIAWLQSQIIPNRERVL